MSDDARDLSLTLTSTGDRCISNELRFSNHFKMLRAINSVLCPTLHENSFYDSVTRLSVFPKIFQKVDREPTSPPHVMMRVNYFTPRIYYFFGMLCQPRPLFFFCECHLPPQSINAKSINTPIYYFF